MSLRFLHISHSVYCYTNDNVYIPPYPTEHDDLNEFITFVELLVCIKYIFISTCFICINSILCDRHTKLDQADDLLVAVP